MNAEALKIKWRKDLIKDDIREMVVDDNILKRLERMPLHLSQALNRLENLMDNEIQEEKENEPSSSSEEGTL